MSEELNEFAKSCEASLDGFDKNLAEQALERFKQKPIESWHVIVPPGDWGNVTNRFICNNYEEAKRIAGKHGEHARIEVVIDLTRKNCNVI